jgi:aspartate-semialdehyde dehydrogenase
MRKLNVAVVGATGAVGEAVLSVLSEKNFPIDNLYPIASSKSAGSFVQYNNKNLEVIDLDDFSFIGVDIAIFSAGGSVSRDYAPIAASEGCVVIDNTSCFRYDDDIPLVVPEVNAKDIGKYVNRNIIANPNCSTIQMLVALKPLHDLAQIKRINVATYQAVSGSGRKAISELASQVGELLNGRSVEPEVYPKQIAFNVLPQIDVFLENGYTREEMKMVWETQKILGDESILVNPTAVRVPVFYGHSMALHVEFDKPITPDAARKILKKAPSVIVIDNPDKLMYPTAVHDAAGSDDVYVGRIRQDISHPSGLDMWVVADNIRRGAATNAVQIAEILSRDYL